MKSTCRRCTFETPQDSISLVGAVDEETDLYIRIHSGKMTHYLHRSTVGAVQVRRVAQGPSTWHVVTGPFPGVYSTCNCTGWGFRRTCAHLEIANEAACQLDRQVSGRGVGWPGVQIPAGS